MLIDTHCHLHFDEFSADRDQVIQRARQAGVELLVNVGTDLESNAKAYQLSTQHDFIFFTAGLHPHHAHEIGPEDLERFEGFVREKKPVAIGEVGLDYSKSEAPAAVQKKIFARVLRLARAFDLPLVVHSRNAFGDTLELLKAEGEGKLRGVMHCFSYDVPALKGLLDIGFLASFTGNVTFKNARVTAEAASWVPLDRLMLETDSPYLAPQVERGKRNEPAYLVHVADWFCQNRGLKREELERRTSENAVGLFRLGRGCSPSS